MTTRATIPKRDVPAGPIPNRKNEVVLDGETAYTTDTPLTDAIADAEMGSTITVGPGDFPENVVLDVEGLTVIGVGRGTVIDGGDVNQAVFIDADDVTVEALSVRTDSGSGINAINTDSDDAEITLEGIRVVTAGSVGINIGSDRCVLRGFIIEDSDSIGVNLQGGADHNTVGLGVLPPTVSGSGIGCGGNNNSFGPVAIEGVGNDGINDDGLNNTWVGVNVEAAGQDGAHLSGTDTTLVGCQFMDSAAMDVRKDGVTNLQMIGCVPAEENTGANRLTSAGWVEHLVDSPNANISNVALDDTDSAEKSVPVPDGETLKVYRWGAYQIADGATPADLDVELLDGTDTVQATENTGDTESTDPAAPVASHENTSGSTSIFKLAVANDTGGTIADPGVGAFYAYVVE